MEEDGGGWRRIKEEKEEEEEVEIGGQEPACVRSARLVEREKGCNGVVRHFGSTLRLCGSDTAWADIGANS